MLVVLPIYKFGHIVVKPYINKRKVTFKCPFSVQSFFKLHIFDPFVEKFNYQRILPGSRSIRVSWTVRRIVGHVASSSFGSDMSSYSPKCQIGLSLIFMCRFGLFLCSCLSRTITTKSAFLDEKSNIFR